MDYQFYRPLLSNESAAPVSFKWITGAWTACSGKCGKGNVKIYIIYLRYFSSSIQFFSLKNDNGLQVKQQVKDGRLSFVPSARGKASHTADFFRGEEGNTTLLNTPALEASPLRATWTC